MTKILIIENSIGTCESAENLLKVVGFEVYTAKNGKEGIQKARDLLPQIVICDINMPKPDGYDVLRALKNNSRTSHISFLFFSGNKDSGDVQKGMDLGANGFLQKPISLKNRINHLAKD